jgi:asparagine synthase (glutamine-hydrolysing)
LKDFLVYYSSKAVTPPAGFNLSLKSKDFSFFTSGKEAELPLGAKCDRLYAYKNVDNPKICQIFRSPNNFRDLVGDFSYALLHEEKLLLAKDHLGIRPLFYYQDEEKFIAATSIPLIKPYVNLDLNKEYIARELQNTPQAVEDTFYANIHRFPPAHYGYFDPITKKLTLHRYWEMEKISMEAYPTEEARYAELTRRWEEAVLCRAGDRGNLGCQLSGGLDSSAIAAVLAKHINVKNIHTYSFVLTEKTRAYSERGIDEQDTQKLVRTHSGLLEENHHTISDFHFENLQAELNRTEQVMGSYTNSNGIWQDTLFMNAASHGVEVMFSGFPGDECVSAPATRYYYNYFGEGKTLNYLLQNPLKHSLDLARYLRNRRRGSTQASFAKINAERNYLNPHYKAIKPIPSFPFFTTYSAEMKSQITRPHTCLRTESEGTYARTHGIETVYPMADIRLITFVYSLPTEMFKPEPYTRRIFRELCKGLLPEEVRTQNKNNGALTLAFAEYWHRTKKDAFRSISLKDPLNMIQLEKLEEQGVNIGLLSRQVKVMELAYSIQQNLSPTEQI